MKNAFQMFPQLVKDMIPGESGRAFHCQRGVLIQIAGIENSPCRIIGRDGVTDREKSHSTVNLVIAFCTNGVGRRYPHFSGKRDGAAIAVSGAFYFQNIYIPSPDGFRRLAHSGADGQFGFSQFLRAGKLRGKQASRQKKDGGSQQHHCSGVFPPEAEKNTAKKCQSSG